MLTPPAAGKISPMDELTRIDAAPTGAQAPAATADAALRRPRDTRREDLEAHKLVKRVERRTGEAIADFSMIEAGDRVMVCLSGGKDSYGLLDILLALRRRAPISFDIVAVNLDQKQPGFPAEVLPRYLTGRGVEFHIAEQDTYSVVKRLIPEGETMCSLCSRLRRGVLYRVAGELKATKIALGHHADDLMATFFLNLFFGGKLKTMPPKLVSDNGKHVVIRPLAYVRERDLARFAELRQFPLIPCTLCGSQEHLQRKQITLMLREWEHKSPGRIDSIFHALGTVQPSHLLDRRLQDFAALRATGRPEPEGDIAFDVDVALETAVDAAAGVKPAAATAIPLVPLTRAPGN